MSAKQPNAKYKITRFLVQDMLVVKDGIGRPHHLGSYLSGLSKKALVRRSSDNLFSKNINHLGGYLSGLNEGWVRTSSDDLFFSSNTCKSY